MPTAARKNGIFKAVSLVPDVCKTPMGPNMVPVPYPVIADLSRHSHSRGSTLKSGLTSQTRSSDSTPQVITRVWNDSGQDSLD
ncbi:PAAR-like domain-containing protein [Herbaspirillum huttiense]|uniref:PAAR-like domain-containing protein n=1 Tax=Herbaspirillum huttiense TaxID=863372 RepID=UPI003CF2EC41